MPPEADFMIYGASGFTGQLLARAARDRGLRPILAGRSPDAVEPLGRELGCETRVLSLDDTTLARSLEGLCCVLLAAGPFSRTSRPMVEACLTARCHYLDLSGELDSIAACYARHEDARAAGVAIVPAVGFSVVPMECLAATLGNERERPIVLELAFEGYDLSPGTAKTYAEGIALGTARRKDGQLVRSPLRWQLVTIPFERGVAHALPVPYGELESCHYATGIPNIVVSMVPPPSLRPLLRYGPRLSSWLRFGWARQVVDRLAELHFKGPGEVALQTKRTQIWGQVRYADGSSRQGFLETPEPYALTVRTALAAVERVRSRAVRPGAWTPSQAFGPRFVLEVGGCRMALLPRAMEAA